MRSKNNEPPFLKGSVLINAWLQQEKFLIIFILLFSDSIYQSSSFLLFKFSFSIVS